MNNSTIKKYNSISDAVLDNANMFPERIAIVDRDGNRKTTEKELGILINQIAHYALRSGMTGVVPVVQERTMEYVATVLGLNLAGLAVSPLTEDYPTARIEYIKKDLGAKTVADASFVECAKKLPAVDFPSRCNPEDIAWVIYTSGSTGMPKGVVYTNIGIYSECLKLESLNEMNGETVSMATSSMSFCGSIVDIYAPLCCGGTVHIASEECRKDKSIQELYLLEHAITHAFIPPRMLSKMHLELPAMKVVSTAGERVSGLSPRNYKIHVLYGMTESLASATYFVLDRSYDNTPIGKPTPGTEIYLLDGKGNLADEGEICIAGGISAGYWNLPELTNRVFTDNPFSNDPEHSVLLHTGDIGKRLPDGNLLFINRNDWMIKINGQRVEPGEVEFQIKAIDGVTEAVVKGFTNVHGQAYLCAFYTSDESVTEKTVRARLKSTLAAYMMPAFIIKTDAFSMNINGKLDRNALTAPEASVFQTAYEAPKTDAETALCKGFQMILGVESIGRNDDFFSLGGDSIQAVSLCAELTKYGLKSADVFKGRTPKGIAVLLETKRKEKAGSYKDSDESYPLTAGQTGVYYACIDQPNSLMYNIPFACKLPPDTDIEKMRRAIEKAVNSFSAFGTRFCVIDGEVRMLKRSKYVDIQIQTAHETDIADIKKLFIRPFDMEKGELARFLLVKTERSLHLIADIHHIIFDGSSVGVFLNAIAKAYAGEEIPPETVSIFEAACMEHDAAATEEYKKAEEFFAENISRDDFDSSLVFDYPENSENTDCVGETIESDFDEIVDPVQMEYFSRKNGVTEATVFTGAFAWALSKMSGNDGVRFCTVDNGRSSSSFEDTVGMLVRTLPLAVSVDETMSSCSYLRLLSTLLYETMEHDIYPFFKLSETLGVNNDTMFVYQADMLNHFGFGNHEVEIEPLDTGFTMSLLSVQVLKTHRGYKTVVTYRSDLYEESKIHTLISLMKYAVSGFVQDLRLKDIPLVNHAVIRLLETFHGEDTEYEPCSVVDLMCAAVKNYPDNIAVVCGERKLTYRELDEITDRLAAYLVKNGIEKEDVVAILSGRDEMMAICPIAVLKAGAAYQPLDSTYPVDRLTFMAKDSGAKLLITPKELRHLVAADIAEFFTEDIPALPECDISLPKPSFGDAFAILYTSGSTGNPKGCVLEHRNLVSYIQYFSKAFCLTAQAKVPAYSSFGFDASMQDIFSTLCAGATVYVIPLDMRLDLERLNRYFEENNITHAFMTTQIGRQFAVSVDNHSLKYLILGGESLTPIAPPENYTIVNGYGPTETTVIVTFYHVDRFYRSIPIGRANENTALYVVDKFFRRVPVGVPGELCIAGPQVSRGYLNLPEKTAEVFVENPFTDEAKYKRMYRTGDIVCFLPDGNLQFIGRKDSQVKVRGFRIELTEVEEIIRRFEGIKDATVAAFDDPAGGVFLAAYVVSDNEVDVERLNEFIRLEKPSYMVPAVTMQIERIPLTQNQKVNKNALPKPKVTQNRNYVPPKNDAEKDFCDMMGQTLSIEKYSAVDSFFEVGGSSISATKVLVSALARGYAVAYSDLFKYPSPRAIAEHIQAMRQSAVTSKADDDITQYDYSAIHSLIQKANIKDVDRAIHRDPTILNGKLGNILLTGVTGFLGIHILREYITHYSGRVICLIRKNDRLSAENRLRSLLFFYFSNDYAEAFMQGRIICVDADLNDDLSKKLGNSDFDTVIHCAACVKHFVSNNILFRVNAEGTKNILQFCEERGKRFIHISTYSVCGVRQDGMDREILSENELYIGQRIDNEYVRTKYQAERYVLEAALRGADVKIMRLGNLMGRISDGEFQINFMTNGFMRDIRGVTALGYSSAERSDKTVDFSPIDCTAEAVLKIADSNLPVFIYHVYNDRLTRADELTNIFEECGFPIKIVSEAEYRQQIKNAAQKYKDDAYMSDIIGGLVAYKDAKTGTEPEAVNTSNAFTSQILERLSFTWPKIEKPYIRKMLENLMGMGFFDALHGD